MSYAPSLFEASQIGPPASLDATFAALADPTRRAILARLALGEATVIELAEPFSMSQPAVSKHLKVLERAGLISRGRDAQRRPCKLQAQPLAEAQDWIERYRECWEQNFQRLDALLEELKAEDGKTATVKTRRSKRITTRANHQVMPQSDKEGSSFWLTAEKVESQSIKTTLHETSNQGDLQK